MTAECDDGTCPVYAPAVTRKRISGTPLPLNEQFDVNPMPPVECSLHVGDTVQYTNDYGVKWIFTVTGFADSVTSWGAFIHLDWDCHWYPVRPDRCVLLEAATRDMTQDGYMVPCQ